MLNSFPVAVLAGVILGFMAGLGIGGGTLLVLWLTLVIKIEPGDARLINLLFFLASAGSVTLLRWKQKSVNWKQIFPAIASGCIAAAIFAWLSGRLDTGILRPMFGILLLATGIRELCYRPKELR